MSNDKAAATHHPHTPPAHYVITLRVSTTREPRDDPWPWAVRAVEMWAESWFKTRPTGPLAIWGATVEQVESPIKPQSQE